jgi:hypothetical protein
VKLEHSDNQIVRQLFGFLQDQHRMIVLLVRNDLAIIEAIQSQVPPSRLRSAASTVLATLYSADELSDRILRLDAEIQRQG